MEILCFLSELQDIRGGFTSEKYDEAPFKNCDLADVSLTHKHLRSKTGSKKDGAQRTLQCLKTIGGGATKSGVGSFGDLLLLV